MKEFELVGHEKYVLASDAYAEIEKLKAKLFREQALSEGLARAVESYRDKLDALNATPAHTKEAQ
jgi:hypothetical protein